MGKHAAPRAARGSDRDRAVHPHAKNVRAPLPAALLQTFVFGGLAVAVTVVALAWAGAGATTALAVGAGLLVLGAVAFLVLRRTGLLAARTPDAGPTATITPSPHP